MWQQELEWLNRCCKGKGINAGLLKLAAAETLYHCWIFRNETCFGKVHNRDKVVNNIQDTIIHRGCNYRKYREHIARILM